MTWVKGSGSSRIGTATPAPSLSQGGPYACERQRLEAWALPPPRPRCPRSEPVTGERQRLDRIGTATPRPRCPMSVLVT